MVIKLIKISNRSPEAYDIYKLKFLKSEILGKISLRFGKLNLYDSFGKVIYSHNFEIWSKSNFYDNKERKKYLEICKEKIKEYYSSNHHDEDDVFPFED